MAVKHANAATTTATTVMAAIMARERLWSSSAAVGAVPLT